MVCIVPLLNKSGKPPKRSEITKRKTGAFLILVFPFIILGSAMYKSMHFVPDYSCKQIIVLFFITDFGKTNKTIYFSKTKLNSNGVAYIISICI